MFKVVLISFMIVILIALDSNCQSSGEHQDKGRISLIFTSTVYAVGLYGWGIPYVFDVESARFYVGSEMVSAFSGFTLSLIATRNYKGGPTMAKLIQGGSLVGTIYGIVIPIFFDEDRTERYITSMMLMTPIGAGVGYALSRRGDLSEGTAEMGILGALMGAGYGFGIPYAINIEDMKGSRQAKIYSSSIMLGIPVGAITLYMISQSADMSKGDARLVELGSCLGAYYGYALMLFAQPETTRPYVTSMMITTPIGTATSYLLVRHKDFSTARSMLIISGTALGNLFGMGMAYLFGADSWKELTLGAMIATPVALITSTIFSRSLQTKTGFASMGDQDNIYVKPILNHSLEPGLAIQVSF